ncbi:cytochrome c oxidase subunit II [Aquimarina sp. U1-2]|uniref:cytochrome c oxidase subunit II n=1 Tax=Aquimarina sp. U1-2 TaxID=2823141 RepID=UPI001AECBA51|nr:cytochrome c oxidase subunit II [Aquimarina sp. U1-2]MBP2832521.1 cytochrome c oxidase subunit II [Aquimarina sp. U1-2]
MTVFLTIVIIALFGITLWQMSKILKLSQLKNADDSQVANDKDNNMQGKLMLGFVIFIYLLTIFCFVQYHSFFLPESASEHGVDYDQLMFISMVLIMFVQIITQGLLHYFAYKYRGKKGNKALFFADNDKLEFIWTIIPVIVLAGLIIYGLFTWTDIMNIDEEEGDPLIIELYAYQFDWRARYSGEDNVLGKANVRFIEGINTLGIDASDGYSKDDKVTNELHLPVNRKVIFKMRSQDVLHSAYMPFFRAQMNVVPGMITEFAYTPTKTTEEMRNSEFMIEKVATINKIRKEKSKALVAAGDEALETYEFDYYLLCNKICGASHYNMQMKIIVESEEEYQEWLKTQQTFSEQLSAQASN